MKPMFCVKCGKQIDSDSLFCAYCGAKVKIPMGESGKQMDSVKVSRSVSEDQKKQQLEQKREQEKQKYERLSKEYEEKKILLQQRNERAEELMSDIQKEIEKEREEVIQLLQAEKEKLKFPKAAPETQSTEAIQEEGLQYCPKCGYHVGADVYCGKCGNKVK